MTSLQLDFLKGTKLSPFRKAKDGSKVWQYFGFEKDKDNPTEVADKTRVVCAICSKKLTFQKSSTSTMWNHLRYLHSEYFMQLSKAGGPKKDPAVSLVSWKDFKELCVVLHLGRKLHRSYIQDHVIFIHHRIQLDQTNVSRLFFLYKFWNVRTTVVYRDGRWGEGGWWLRVNPPVTLLAIIMILENLKPKRQEILVTVAALKHRHPLRSQCSPNTPPLHQKFTFPCCWLGETSQKDRIILDHLL